MNCAFITDEQRALLLANGRESLQNPDFDPVPVVKLFTPDAGATWLLSELDPDDMEGTRAFGLCDLGLGMPELGWLDLSELASVRGRLGLPVERDLHFRAEKRFEALAMGGLAALPGERPQILIKPAHGSHLLASEPAVARSGAPFRCSYVAPSAESARSSE
jgi:hypothetical protein